MWWRRRADRVEHVFTREDREAQLCDLESLCERIAVAFANHGDALAAELFAARSRAATRLLADGWDQADLNALGGQFPSVDWLNPKYADFNGPREPWQDEVAKLHALASATASDLRAIATLYDR